MIIFFGPAGAGKSVQGQILAARHGWRWLSAGQLLRDTHDPELLKRMSTGELVSSDDAIKVMADAIERSKDITHVILDGFPRELGQAKWLVESSQEHGRSIELVVVLEVPKSELLKRLQLRGRVDDTPEVIEDRLQIYRKEIYPILSYLTEQKVPIVHIDGTGSVGQVHDRIATELEACSLA
ncbi:MAG: adenylate kinase family protein [Candidatus Saccharimonadales bacterium]